jgi:ribonucleoside-triphosphate reductase
MSNWSNLAKVVYKRTYARKDSGQLENWADTVERVIAGNVQGHNVSTEEIERLRYYLMNRKAGPAGRGWWYSGAPSHKRLGGVALNNCWFVASDEWNNFVLAQDLLMLGGGVGMSVEHRFVSKLPRLKKDVNIVSRETKDADFIVPDSREGWNELTRRVLEAYFVTGKSFSYSTVCIRPAGEPINGFGGVSSGPKPLVTYVEKLVALLKSREGKHLRPVDAADILCSIGEMVVSGNVRRSAIIILGDPWDKEYLKAKRWDLGNIPTQRAMANFSVVVDDVEDLHPLFWKTYEQGEPFGLVNRKNIQKFARMGDLKPDSAIGVNPCLTGDTLVMTVLGEKTIKELADSNANFDVYSYDEEKKEVVTKNAIAFKTKEDAEIMLLKTKSGKEIKLTPDHRVLTDKGWVQAKDLTKEHKLYKIS